MARRNAKGVAWQRWRLRPPSFFAYKLSPLIFRSKLQDTKMLLTGITGITGITRITGLFD